jgi:acetylornithine/succinyldiaminopimelate/putrescine aminotransferase
MNTRERYAKYLLPVVAQGVEPLVVASAKGRTVVDEEGRSYLDCFSGISVVNAGHNHPKILAAAREQMEQLVHCCSYVYHVPVVGRLAEQCHGRARRATNFSQLGAEAIEGRCGWPSSHRQRACRARLLPGRTIGPVTGTGAEGGGLLPTSLAPRPCYRCPSD